MEESAAENPAAGPGIDRSDDVRVRPAAWRSVLLILAAAAGNLLILVYRRQPDALAAITLIPAWCWLFAAAILLLETRPAAKSVPWLLCLIVTLAYAALCVEQSRSLLRGPLRLPGKSTGSPRAPWRIVSLNCFVGTYGVVDDLRPWEPDLVLLQESPSRDALDRMAADLFGSEAASVSTGDCSIVARGRLEFVPNAPAARFVQARWTPPRGPEVMVFSLRLTPPPTRLDVWRADCWRIHRLRREVHRRQIAELAAALSAVPAGMPIIVGGDFNSPAGDGAHAPLQERLQDSFALAGRGWGQTFYSGFPFHRIDQIWTSAELVPVTSGAMVAEHSDHRAAICDVAPPTFAARPTEPRP